MSVRVVIFNNLTLCENYKNLFLFSEIPDSLFSFYPYFPSTVYDEDFVRKKMKITLATASPPLSQVCFKREKQS